MKPTANQITLGALAIAAAILIPLCCGGILPAAELGGSGTEQTITTDSEQTLAETLGQLLLFAGAAGMAYGLRDKQHENTTALPDGAAAVNCDGFDLDQTTSGDFLAQCEIEISAPALTTGELGDADTMTYAVYHDSASDFGSEALLADKIIVQTGAGGAGAAAATARFRLPTDVSRYVRIKATNSAAGDASGKSMTTRLLF